MAALLRMLRRALFIGVAFTGISLGFAVSHGEVHDATVYVLLCGLCVLGLMVKTADKRPTA